MNNLTLIILFSLLGSISGLVYSIQIYPILEVKRLFRTFLKEGFKPGEWKHYREFIDHNTRIIVKPNCETLYSTTFIKPGNTKHLLEIPCTDEYFSISFLDRNTDVLGYLTNKDLKKNKISRFTLEKGKVTKHDPKSGKIILDTSFCWIIARFGINSEGELKKTHGLQDRMLLIRDRQ